MTNVHNYISNFLRSDHKRVTTIVRLAIVASMLCTLGIALSVFTAQAQAAQCAHPYTVKNGDTLSQIASRYNSNLYLIAKNNNIADVNLVYINQQLCLPNTHIATKTVAKPATPTIKSAPKQVPAPKVIVKSAPVQPSAPIQTVQPNVAGSDVNGLINEIFGQYAASAKRVAMCESGMNPGAKNPSSSASGVFQILYPSTWDTTSQASQSPYNAQANITAAHEIFVRDGYSWREWSCQP